jgi:hypothetical protein
MAKGGAFGNPLTTGIALNFEVDMTPYRQMMQDNLQFAQTQAAERKAKEKEFQDILKNITYDDSKIHSRMRPEARLEYASTINDVINLKKNNDLGGVMNRIAKFDSKLNNYVDGTTNFRAYEKAAADGTNWVDNEYITAFNNPEKFSTADLIDKYSAVATFDKESGVFSSQATPKQDALAFVNKYMGGMQYNFEIDNGKVGSDARQTGTGAYVYRKSKSEDPESFYRELGAAWLGGGRDNIEDMRRNLNLKPEDLEGNIDTPSGPVAKSLHYATEFMRKFAEPQMYSDVTGSPPAEKTPKATYGLTDKNIGDVSFSSKPSSAVSTESSTPEQIKQGRLDYVTNELQGPYDVAKSKDPDDIEDAFGGDGGFKNVVESYGLTWDIPFAPRRQEVEITAGGVAHLLDPTKPDFVQKVANLVISGGNEGKVTKIASTPETTPEEFLTPESDSFFANLAGGKKPTTDWMIPAGTTVILTGDQGAVEVKLKNDMTLEDGKFQKAAKYKGKSGEAETYYDIMFPIAKRDEKSYFTNLFNDKNVLTEFKKKSPDQLPTSMYIKEDNGLFKSLLSVLQNRSNVGTMTEGSLQKAMDEIMKVSAPARGRGITEMKESEIAAAAAARGDSEAEYRQLLIDNDIKIVPSGGAASASSSSSASVPSSDIQKMSGMKYGDFNNASNKAWVDETAKKIRSMSNLDDLWKQTGKSGTPNGQSNAELLAGFVESGKTSLLTGTTSSTGSGTSR